MPLDSNERMARLQLARSAGIGPVTFRRLIERYGSAQRAAEQVPELSRRGGRAKPLTLAPISDVKTELEKIHRAGSHLVTYGDDDYPSMLSAIEDAPMTLTVRGQVSLLKKSMIGIVGSRNASLQGRRFAENIAAELGRAGLVIASGLARGIDTAAHTASLATGTVAVVAGGVDVIYPSENEALYAKICEAGAIVAENAFGTQPTAQHFPRRNRIISGLSLGVAIVEGTLKSGSLITAHVAADQGREVWAVPGHPMDPRSGGPNALIRDGATLITGPADILDTLSRLQQRKIISEPKHPPALFPANDPDAGTLDAARAALIPLLSAAPCGVDDLIAETKIPASVVQIVLLELELAGRLTRHPGNRVSAPYIEYGVDKPSALL